MKVPNSETPSVGIREFRAALAEYIDADMPVTVTRHGQAVGLFVPLRRPSAEDVQRLQTAAANFRKTMPSAAYACGCQLVSHTLDILMQMQITKISPLPSSH